MNGEKWLQDRDPRQNSKAAQKSWKELGCTMFSIPARSPISIQLKTCFILSEDNWKTTRWRKRSKRTFAGRKKGNCIVSVYAHIICKLIFGAWQVNRLAFK